MDWTKWCETYPARDAKLDDLTAAFAEGHFDTQIEAEKRREWLEETHERGGFEVVRCIGKFWIVG